MKYKILSTRTAIRGSDAHILCIHSEPRPATSSPVVQALGSLGIGLAEIKRTDGFAGLPSQEALLRIVRGRTLKRVILLGLGRRDDVTATHLRRRLERAGVLARARDIARPAVILPDGLPVSPELAVRAVVTGLELGATPPPTYAAKRRARGMRAGQAQIVLPGGDARRLSRVASSAASLAGIVARARSWVAEPANVLGPTELARGAARLAPAAVKGVVDEEPARLRELHDVGLEALLALLRGLVWTPGRASPGLHAASLRSTKARKSRCAISPSCSLAMASAWRFETLVLPSCSPGPL